MVTTTASAGRLLTKLSAPRRNHYYYGKMMDVLQFEMEQCHVLQKRSLLNRLALGTGVLTGLGVAARDGLLGVECGVALDCLGREIVVPTSQLVDPWKLGDARGNPEGELSKDQAHVVTLSVCYDECLTDFAPVLVSDCNHTEDALPGTLVESFRLEIEQGQRAAPGSVLPEECCRALLTPAPPAAPRDAEFGVVATIALAGRPVAVATSPDGRVALVASEAEPIPLLSVIDVATNAARHFTNDLVWSPLGGVCFAPDGGPAFVASAGGLAELTLERDAGGLKWRPIIVNRSYGRCAAALGGRVVFAINLQTQAVEIINTHAKRVMGSLKPGDPVDLAVSPDNHWLSVLRGSDGVVLSYEVIDPRTAPAESPRPDLIGVTLATRVSDEPESYVAAGNRVRVLRPGSVQRLPDTDLDSVDSAFSSDGRLYYAVSAKPAAVAVFAADTLTELARLPVGEGPCALAVVPNRLRAFIANRGSSDVTVVDGRFGRAPPGSGGSPCDCSRPAACEVEPCCVPLAHVELLANGRIGRVDACGARTPILSNQALLELILCLAQRVGEGRGAQDPPPGNSESGTPSAAANHDQEEKP